MSRANVKQCLMVPLNSFIKCRIWRANLPISLQSQMANNQLIVVECSFRTVHRIFSMELLKVSIIHLSFSNASVIHRVWASWHVEKRFQSLGRHETFIDVIF